MGKDDEDIVEETQQLSSRTQIETEDPSLKSYKTENEDIIVKTSEVLSSHRVVDDNSLNLNQIELEKILILLMNPYNW